MRGGRGGGLGTLGVGIRGAITYLRSQWRALRRPAEVDGDMQDEMRFHMEMDAQRRMRQGLGAADAQRQAALAFGGVEKYRGASRDALGFTWTRGLAIDLRLGGRMLVKYPGLTGVAVFALSLAIGAGAAYLEFVNDLLHGRLPFVEGDRIAGIQIWDQQTGLPEHRATADFVEWRRELRAFEALAATGPLDRNLITDDGRAEPARGVEISASAFRIARVAPLIGRTLVDADEQPGATPVVVIGYDLWMARFDGDPTVIGRAVRLGASTCTVVGVMPESFGLPVRHNLWIPLSLHAAHYPRKDGAPIRVFGRLAPGVTMASAQAELSAIAQRHAMETPETDRFLRPVVKPYVESRWSAVQDSKIQTAVFYSANVLSLGLLALCGANIATLVFARTASRQAEISVRTALGASRARITGQFVIEALVLCGIAAVCGLAGARYATRWAKDTVTAASGQPMMFWWNDDLSFASILYAGALAVVAALIIGVTPAWKATGPRVQAGLRSATGGSTAGMRFGGVWTAVIVTQVAFTTLFLAVVALLAWTAYGANGGDRARQFPDTDYVSAQLTLERPSTDVSADTKQAQAAYARRLGATYTELARRLAAEPGMTGVTYAARLPGMNHQTMRIEIDGASRPPPTTDATPRVRTTRIGVNFVEVFRTPIVAGRAFTDADLADGRHVAIVDRTFVRQVFGDRPAIGQRVREAGAEGRAAGPWLEIIGVIGDLTDPTNKTASDAVIYRPARADTLSPLHVAVHAPSNPMAAMARMRIVAGEVDPTLRLLDLQTTDHLSESDRVALDFFTRLLGGVSAVALLLAIAGVYALMAFTVARRTPEIGIRLALGASTRRIVWSTFSRALAQVGLGVLIGSLPAVVLVRNLASEVSAVADSTTVAVACLVATGVVLAATAMACVGPARRALRVQPTDALKAS